MCRHPWKCEGPDGGRPPGLVHRSRGCRQLPPHPPPPQLDPPQLELELLDPQLLWLELLEPQLECPWLEWLDPVSHPLEWLECEWEGVGEQWVVEAVAAVMPLSPSLAHSAAIEASVSLREVSSRRLRPLVEEERAFDVLTLGEA